MVIFIKNGDGDQSSNPEPAVYTSYSADIFGKGIHPIVLPPAMSKQQNRLSS